MCVCVCVCVCVCQNVVRRCAISFPCLRLLPWYPLSHAHPPPFLLLVHRKSAVVCNDVSPPEFVNDEIVFEHAEAPLFLAAILTRLYRRDRNNAAATATS